GLGDGLAGIAGFDLGDFGDARVQEVADLPEDAAPVGAGHLGPGSGLERLAGSPDRPIDVFGAPLRDLGQGLFSGRIDRREGAGGDTIPPLAADVPPTARTP